jgi:hypothetical protein
VSAQAFENQWERFKITFPHLGKRSAAIRKEGTEFLFIWMVDDLESLGYQFILCKETKEGNETLNLVIPVEFARKLWDSLREEGYK